MTKPLIMQTLEEQIANFDFSTLFVGIESFQNTTTENKPQQLSGSAEAARVRKASKEADEKFNPKRKRIYASNYEKGLITISEKHNGEI